MLERTGPVRDREQLHRGGGDRRAVRRRGSVHRSAGAERHHHPPQPHHPARVVAGRELGREESARAQERPLRPDRRQPDREQLGGRTVGLRRRVHRPRSQHVARPGRRSNTSASRTTSCGIRVLAINVLGYDDGFPSQQLRDLVIRNNLFTDIDHRAWGGSGIFMQMGDEPADVHVEHNTVMHSGNIISVYGGTARRTAGVAGLPLRQQHRPAQHLRHLREQRRHRQPGDRRLLPGERDRRQRHRRRQPQRSIRPATCSRRWRT